MIENVVRVEELGSTARSKSKSSDYVTVRTGSESDHLDKGWTLERKHKRTVRLSRPKSHGVLLEDRVWTLLYRMGFDFMSSSGGGRLAISSKEGVSPTSQIDVVAIDPEVAIAIECKSSERYARKPQFTEELAKHGMSRTGFTTAVRRDFPTAGKRLVGFAMFTMNYALLANDRARAEEQRVELLDENDLEYYEQLVAHLGPAAKYQFLSEIFPGRTIPNLEIKVPAIRTKMAKRTAYSFAISPDYLLKIAYVSHRAKGKASDVDTYQRMLRKSRLRSIKRYIEDEQGIFPTNLVINLAKSPQFDKVAQESESEQSVLGWITLRPAYGSAWIIDGQHRLFAYSGSPRSATSRLTVLAFDSLEPSLQAKLFIDINAQQKTVKQSLLQELYSELHWDSDDPKLQTSAVVAKAVQSLGRDQGSPFFGRIQSAESGRDEVRCISLDAMFKALNQSDLYLSQNKRGVDDPGPLWSPTSSTEMMRRTCSVLNAWFEQIAENAPDWWTIGRGPGGGLSMNDSIVANIMVLRSVFDHLGETAHELDSLYDGELVELIQPFARTVGEYLGRLPMEERQGYRDLRGVQGQTARSRRIQVAIREAFPNFSPAGLDEFIEEERVQSNQQARALIERIEQSLQRSIIEELKREYGEEGDRWWFDGVPEKIRKSATALFEEDKGDRGERYHYFNLIDYRDIVNANWNLLGGFLAQGSSNIKKERRTSWIVDVNEARKIVMHSSSGKNVSLEQLQRLQSINDWLGERVMAKDIDDENESSLENHDTEYAGA